MATKLLMIGLDAGDRSLIDQLISAQHMPVLAELRRRGTSGRLAALPGLGDDASWTTFSTSVNPGVHGRFNYLQPVPGTYSIGFQPRTGTTHPPFWKALADTGMRVAVVDVPKSPLAGLTSGFEMADWMPHGQDSSRTIINPPDHRLAGHLMQDPEFDCEHLVLTREEAVSHAKAVRARGESRRLHLLDLLTEDWDLFIAAVAETHCAGHHFWHYHDVSHARHDVEAARDVGDLVAAEYQEADTLLGDLLKAAGPDATVVVFGLLGMGPNHQAGHLMDEILARIDGDATPPPNHSWLKRWVPRRVKSLAGRLLPGTVSAIASPNTNRKMFRVPHDAVSAAVRLNVKGREPNGSIEPGGDYDAWCQRVIEALLALENADTGGRVIREVVRVADVYPGPRSNHFADLLAVWDTEAPVTRIRSDELGEFAGSEVYRSGNHVPGGWFTMAGPGIARSERSADGAIADLGPTVASLLGVELPEAEGHPIDLGVAHR